MTKRRAALRAIAAFPMALLMTPRSMAQPSAKSILIGILDASDRVEWWDAFRQQREHADAVIVVQNPLMYTDRAEITKLAIQFRIPSMYGAAEYVAAGGLMSYASSYPELFRRASVYVDKILKGANPGDLPIEQPATFELTINAGTVRTLGIAVPSSMLARASA